MSLRRLLVVCLLLALPACSRACSKPSPTGETATTVQGSIAGHAFRARSAVLVRSTGPSKDHVAAPTVLLLFATEVSCARWGAAELFEPHVRIRNLPNGDAPGRQRVWFDLCVRYDDASTPECRIQSNEAWLDLEAGSRNVGARLRGDFEARRDASVKADENGRIAGRLDAVVCDADAPAGLKLLEDPDEEP